MTTSYLSVPFMIKMCLREKKNPSQAKLKALNTKSFNYKGDQIQEEITPFGKFVTKTWFSETAVYRCFSR